MKKFIQSSALFSLFFSLLFFSRSAGAQEYVLIAWNDLGMHCSNKDFSKIAILPPYNTIIAQLLKKSASQSPEILTDGYEIHYSIPYNTYSAGKTNFWTYAQQLFDLAQPLPDNVGLTGKGLTGTMDINGNYFHAVGIPVTPYPDTSLSHEKPYQLIHLEAYETGSSVILAATDVVIPVSNELGCVQAGCHSSEQAILNDHESVSGFNPSGPNLCAKCHADNALNLPGNPEAGSLSYRLHAAHVELNLPNTIETCYKCHPGPNTQCLRGVMRTGIANPLICQDCHGSLANVAQTIQNGRRPWLDEPQCGNSLCHGSKYAEEAGKLFRESQGHGALFCSACHGSPHAIYPTAQPNDNLQNIRLQGYAGILRDCLVCHENPPAAPGPHGVVYTHITASETKTPSAIKLMQNYPNPFNPVTTIEFDIPRRSYVTLTVYNTLGEKILSLVNQQLEPGSYRATWDASAQPSGVYYYKLIYDNSAVTKRMVLTK